jgi:hypothetical protein
MKRLFRKRIVPGGYFSEFDSASLFEGGKTGLSVSVPEGKRPVFQLSIL